MVRQPRWIVLLQDVLRLLVLGTLVGSFTVAFMVVPPLPSVWIDGPVRLAAGFAAELSALFLMRTALPVARPGAHRVGWNADYLRWLTSCALNDVAMLSVVRGPFDVLDFGRVLFFSALGARIPWTVAIPREITLRDPSLCKVGAGAQLESGVIIETALHGAGRVHVGRVDVGSGCLLGAHCLLMPGVVIAHDVRIGPRALIGEEAQIGVGATLGPSVQVGQGADVGSYANVGAGAVLGTGVRVGDRARVAGGASVEEGVSIPEREYWAGVPAAQI